MSLSKDLLRAELTKPKYAEAVISQDWKTVLDLVIAANIRIARGVIPGWQLLRDFSKERTECRVVNDPQLMALLLTLEVELAAAGSEYDADGDDIEAVMQILEGAQLLRDRDGLPLDEQKARVKTVQYIPTVPEITAAVFNDDGTRAV